MAQGPETISFAAAADSSEIVNIKNAKHEVSFSMQGARPVKPKIDGSRITYPSVGEGVDLVYVLGSDEPKELVVLHNRPAPGADPAFRFDLHAGDLTPKSTPAGGIDLVDSKGVIQFQIPPGMAMDSNPHPTMSGFGPASLELVREGDGWVVILKSTPAWLDAAEREYPVYLDPSVLFGNFREMGSGYDSFVLQGNPNSNFHSYWNSTYNRFVNYLGNVALISNTYVKFELNQISSNQHIRSACWFGHFEYDGDNPGHGGHPTYALHKVPSSWGPTIITWNNQPPIGTPTKIGDGTPTGWNWVPRKIRATGAYRIPLLNRQQFAWSYASEATETRMDRTVLKWVSGYPE